MSSTTPSFVFDNTYAALPEVFFASVQPTAVPNPQLFALNETLAIQLGLEPQALRSTAGVDILSGNAIPTGAAPLAMAYAGHQFGNWVPQLGDGRALLLGEVEDRYGERQDIQLKGAGRTPFSRNGDGRAWIGPVMREYLVSEAMHGLNVPTTRALSAVTTGDNVFREQGPLPGAVLTRVATSHVRVGTFEYFAARGDSHALEQLVNYVIARHYADEYNHADLTNGVSPALFLLNCVVEKQAQLIADWQSFGFIHGVMNTDNASIAGITIDYGPCAFMDHYEANKVFSSIDRNGRYAYQNQPFIAHWNMAGLAQTLIPLIDDDADKAIELAQEAVNRFPGLYTEYYTNRFREKLGLYTADADDLTLIKALLSNMEEYHADFTLVFRSLSNETCDNLKSQFSNPQAIEPWIEQWQERQQQESLPEAERQQLMRQKNPAYIPRNHRIEEAIQEAVNNNNYKPFNTLHTILKNPFAAQPEQLAYRNPPLPEEAVTQTFCGT